MADTILYKNIVFKDNFSIFISVMLIRNTNDPHLFCQTRLEKLKNNLCNTKNISLIAIRIKIHIWSSTWLTVMISYLPVKGCRICLLTRKSFRRRDKEFTWRHIGMCTQCLVSLNPAFLNGTLLRCLKGEVKWCININWKIPAADVRKYIFYGWWQNQKRSHVYSCRWCESKNHHQ